MCKLYVSNMSVKFECSRLHLGCCESIKADGEMCTVHCSQVIVGAPGKVNVVLLVKYSTNQQPFEVNYQSTFGVHNRR